MVVYEWIVETVDEYGDIIDITHTDSYHAALVARQAIDGSAVDIGLVRDTIADDGDLIDRQWAYIESGQLPDTFDGGAVIPRRFRIEVQRG